MAGQFLVDESKLSWATESDAKAEDDPDPALHAVDPAHDPENDADRPVTEDLDHVTEDDLDQPLLRNEEKEAHQEIIRAVPEGALARDRGVVAAQPLANHAAEAAADPVKSPLLRPRSIPFLRHPIYGTPLNGTLAHNYCVAI